MDSDVGVDAALDEAVLDGLAASLGDGEEGWQFVTELVDVFLVDGDGHVKELRQAVERGDAETARRAAHTLKSNAATFGAGPLTEICREIEALSKDGELSIAEDRLARVDAEWGRVRAGLAAAADARRTA